MADGADAIAGAAVIAPAVNLAETVAFLRDQLGFHLTSIYPADSPRVATLVGHGLSLHLAGNGAPPRLRVQMSDVGGENLEPLTAPNGMVIERVTAQIDLELPPEQQGFVLQRSDAAGAWGVGRAGMLYRDLIPDRQGGRFIASHIRIAEAGSVPDSVHFHKIRFQMIYCYKGWVRVVYEDQGPPFVMQPGDCVLQPPEIRHRVLESGGGLEVIEIGSPAEHMTAMDLALTLPTAALAPGRRFGGQRFQRHIAAETSWHASDWPGFLCRDIGIAAATQNLAGVSVLKPHDGNTTEWQTHQGEFWFGFVLTGSLTLHRRDQADAHLEAADCIVIPKNQDFCLGDWSDDAALLRVTLPGRG